MHRLGGACERRVFEEADLRQHEKKSTRANTVKKIQINRVFYVGYFLKHLAFVTISTNTVVNITESNE